MKAATLVSVLPHVPMFRSCIRNLVCCCVRMYQFSFLSSRRRAVGWNQPTYDRAIPPVHTHTCTSSLSPSLPLSLLPFFPSSLLPFWVRLWSAKRPSRQKNAKLSQGTVTTVCCKRWDLLLNNPAERWQTSSVWYVPVWFCIQLPGCTSSRPDVSLSSSSPFVTCCCCWCCWCCCCCCCPPLHPLFRAAAACVWLDGARACMCLVVSRCCSCSRSFAA